MNTGVIQDLWTLPQKIISYVFVIKNSHKYVSDCGELQRYGYLKLRIQGMDY